jgi:hypothetical protein
VDIVENSEQNDKGKLGTRLSGDDIPVLLDLGFQRVVNKSTGGGSIGICCFGGLMQNRLAIWSPRGGSPFMNAHEWLALVNKEPLDILVPKKKSGQRSASGERVQREELLVWTEKKRQSSKETLKALAFFHLV